MLLKPTKKFGGYRDIWPPCELKFDEARIFFISRYTGIFFPGLGGGGGGGG